MKPTIINILIMAPMDIPDIGWQHKEPEIISKVLEALPKENIRLLTFDVEERINGYAENEKDTILLEVKINNQLLKPAVRTGKPLVIKLKELIESKRVTIKRYSRKQNKESETSQTRISIDVHGERSV